MLHLIRRFLLVGMVATLGSTAVRAQTGAVGIGTTTPDPSALLDLTSSTRGLLAPRMTAAERTAIVNPAPGLLVYQTDGLQMGFWYRTPSAWTYLNPNPAGDNLGTHTATQPLNLGSHVLTGGGSTGLVLDNAGQAVLGGTQGGAAPTAPLELRRPNALSAYMTFHNTNVSWFSFGQDVSDGNKIKISDGNTLTGANLLTLNRGGQLGLGTTNPSNRLDVLSAGRSGTHATGRPLYVTGDMGEASGAEFRHSNATQGVGIGYNSLYAAGTNPDQHLNLLPKGNGGIGVGTTTPHASALLDLTSTTKGLLLPRLTQTQRDAIAAPAAGLTVFNLSSQRTNYFDGVRWTEPLLNQTTSADFNQQLTFAYTGAPQTWVVPTGVTSATIDVYGAAGGSGAGDFGWGAGGGGGRVQATLAVTPGETLTIMVGGAGGAGYNSVNPGGYNGGGYGLRWPGNTPEFGGGGGGATDIRRGGTALANRIVVAGGGGGGASQSVGPCGGGLQACNGANGGSQTAGGGAGASAGSLGQGGNAELAQHDITAGGGGGYYGGGGGSNTRGNGGGSSYTNPGTTSGVVHTQGANTGNGYAVIRFTTVPAAPIISLANATVPLAAGGVVYSDGSRLAAAPNRFFWDNATNRLGVGTAAPAATLHVSGPAATGTVGVPGPNIAAQATATASSVYNTNNRASNINDGSTSTNWSAAGGQSLPQWIQLDFGSTPRTAVQYTVFLNTLPWAAGTWQLQASNDASTWTTLHSVSSNPARGSTLTYPVSSPTAYRYYRLLVLTMQFPTSSQGSDVTIGEWGLMESSYVPSGPALRVSTGTVQLESGAAVRSFATDGTLAGNADDAVPTQKAVKTYVDAQVATAADDLGSHVASQALVLNGQELRLRSASDGNHALRHEGSLDGVGLYGYQGGMLGYNQGSGAQPVLRWSASGHVGIGTTTPQARLHVSGGGIRLDGATALELGGGISGKQTDAGKIGYQLFSDGLDVVGAGTTVAGRKIRLWAEGGTTVNGPLTVEALAGAGPRMLTTDNAGNLGAQPLPTDAQQLSISGSTISLTNGGAVTVPSSADNLGNHTATQTVQMGAHALQFATFMGPKVNLWNSDYTIGVQGGTQYYRSGDAFAWYTGGVHNDGQFNPGGLGGAVQMILKDGKLGLNTTAAPVAPLEVQQRGASPYAYFHQPGVSHFSFGLDHADGSKIKINTDRGFGSGNVFTITQGGSVGIGTTTPSATLDVPGGSVHLPGDSWISYHGNGQNYLRGTTILADNGGRVGIGTASPAFPLDVQGSVTPANYAYGWLNGSGSVGYSGSNTGPVSIRASGRVVATEFNATSDGRLKTIVGLSDNAADLHLLTRLRITDYTMRDRAAYGSRAFKKVIAQEVEAVFPQAVSRHAGFLPDLYVTAAAVVAEGDSLVRLTLPAVATVAAAGQRVKLIGPAAEVIGTVKAATGTTLLVRGAQALAGQPVFVFGLEHPDVRTVDYEALSMLNVSATQELARKMAALEQQNAARQQRAAHATEAATRAAARAATAEAATQSFELRLRELEARLGTARK